jgi:hypothetical protein
VRPSRGRSRGGNGAHRHREGDLAAAKGASDFPINSRGSNRRWMKLQWQVTGCQISDFILGGAYRQELTEHNAEPSNIEESSFVRTPQITLHNTPIFRVPITREILESLKDSLLLEEEERRKFWEERFKKS